MAVLVIDKPVGPSSFQVVRHVRRGLARLWGRAQRDLRIGHGGTLDPAASGVLPVCVGEGTKLAPFLLDADKSYEATVEFGSETDTLDAEGTVIASRPLDGLDGARVEALLPGFRGAREQVPPMYSALKRAGRPLYAYARAGEEVVRAPRPITIHELTLEQWIPPATARLRVTCSKGTYVRVLAADLGRTAGPGAHLRALRRTRSGPFHLGQAIDLAALDALVDAGGPLPFVPLAEALAHLPAVQVPAALERPLSQGQRVATEQLGSARGRCRLLRSDGTLLAVAELGDTVVGPAGQTGGDVRLLRVFASEPGQSNFPTVGLTSTRFL
jgi:tRNA pseudouridine55 synthase